MPPRGRCRARSSNTACSARTRPRRIRTGSGRTVLWTCSARRRPLRRQLTAVASRVISSRMRAVARGAVLALANGLLGHPLAAQASWGPPRPPCELVAGNSKIDKAMQALRGALEKPDQREPQLVQAKKALGEAIAQDNQSTNPAAWYYLGRYYLIVDDVAGADTALTRAATLAPKCAEDIATRRAELLSKLLNDGLAAW